jgi:hypothetical protein
MPDFVFIGTSILAVVVRLVGRFHHPRCVCKPGRLSSGILGRRSFNHQGRKIIAIIVSGG